MGAFSSDAVLEFEWHSFFDHFEFNNLGFFVFDALGTDSCEHPGWITFLSILVAETRAVDVPRTPEGFANFQ